MRHLFKRFTQDKPRREPVSLSALGVDMHSHLIPGVDDGSKEMDETLAILEGMAELGYEGVITTPHVMSDFYRNSSDTLRKGADQVREALRVRGIHMPFSVAAEYYLDEWFEELLAAKDILTFGDNFLLFELGFVTPPEILGRALFNMQLSGYKPILAHPERYPYWHHDFEKYQDLHDKGVLLQVNLNSLTGVYSPQVKKVAEKLLRAGIVSFIGTDCHNGNHLKISRQARYNRALAEWLESGQCRNRELLQHFG